MVFGGTGKFKNLLVRYRETNSRSVGTKRTPAGAIATHGAAAGGCMSPWRSFSKLKLFVLIFRTNSQKKIQAKTDQESKKENTPADELNQNDTVWRKKLTRFYYSNWLHTITHPKRDYKLSVKARITEIGWENKEKSLSHQRLFISPFYTEVSGNFPETLLTTITDFATSAEYLQIDPYTECNLHYGPVTLFRLQFSPQIYNTILHIVINEKLRENLITSEKIFCKTIHQSFSIELRVYMSLLLVFRTFWIC